MKPPNPSLADEGIIPKKSTFLVFDLLPVKRPLPFHILPLEVFVETNLITFSDTPFELANAIFEEPLNSFRPRAFHLFGGRLQGWPSTTIVWSRTDPFPRDFPILPSCVQLRFRRLGHTPDPGTCLRQVGGAMSAAFDSSVSVSNDAMSSMLPAIVFRVGKG